MALEHFSIGEVIDGRYRIESVLGRGSRSTVYQAIQIESGQAVAIKQLSPQLALDPQYRARFEREVLATASLGHPNVTSVYGAGKSFGRSFMVMQLVDGLLLEDILSERGALPRDEVQAIVRQICSGVAAAHAAGVAHRNLTLGNIFVSIHSDLLHVTVADFGRARVAGKRITGTEEGQQIDEPAFLPPEMVDSTYVLGNDPAKLARADMYAIGCIAFCLLHGRPPLMAEQPLETLLRRLVADGPDWDPDVLAAIPSAFGELINQLLATAPEERPTAAKAVERISAMTGRTQRRASKPNQVTLDWGSSPVEE